MKNKRNRIAIVMVIMLSSITFWISRNNGKSTIKPGLREFAVADTGSITKIFLADKAKNTVTLEKIKPGEWKVNGTWTARPDAINTLLYTIKALEVREPVGKKAQPNIIKDLASGATKVEIYKGTETKPFKVYFVGSETQDQTGTYMLLQDAETGENSSIPFIMYIPGFEGYLTTRYFTRAGDWRTHEVFNYSGEEIKRVKVEYPRSIGNSFIVENQGRNTFNYIQTIPPGSKRDPFDTLAVKQYLTYFKNIHFEEFERSLKKETKDSIVAAGPSCLLTVIDQAGTETSMKIYPMPNFQGKTDPQGKVAPYDMERLYAFINDGQDFVVIQYFVFGTILQEPPYFALKKGVKRQ